MLAEKSITTIQVDLMSDQQLDQAIRILKSKVSDLIPPDWDEDVILIRSGQNRLE